MEEFSEVPHSPGPIQQSFSPPRSACTQDSAGRRILFETGLPPRYYFPPEDVSEDVLLPSDKRTECPYKGVASCYSVRAGGGTREAIVWHYPDPIPAAAGIEGHLCFFNEKVDLEVDGEAQQRPQTQWS